MQYWVQETPPWYVSSTRPKLMLEIKKSFGGYRLGWKKERHILISFTQYSSQPNKKEGYRHYFFSLIDFNERRKWKEWRIVQKPKKGRRKYLLEDSTNTPYSEVKKKRGNKLRKDNLILFILIVSENKQKLSHLCWKRHCQIVVNVLHVFCRSGTAVYQCHVCVCPLFSFLSFRCEQRRRRRVCAHVQTRLRICCSPACSRYHFMWEDTIKDTVKKNVTPQ